MSMEVTGIAPDTVYVTWYWETRGIVQARVKKRIINGRVVLHWPGGFGDVLVLEKTDYADTLEGAILSVKAKRDRRIRLLQNRLKKLVNLPIEQVTKIEE